VTGYAELNVPQSADLSNHQAYVKTWLHQLRNDNRYIFRASTAANKAADYLLSFSRQPDPEPVEVPF
jgi:antirestriction protein ArdC